MPLLQISSVDSADVEEFVYSFDFSKRQWKHQPFMRSSNAVNFGKHCLLLGWVRTCCRSINELFSYLNCNWPMALHKFSAHTPHGSRLRDKTVLSSRLKVKVQVKNDRNVGDVLNAIWVRGLNASVSAQVVDLYGTLILTFNSANIVRFWIFVTFWDGV